MEIKQASILGVGLLGGSLGLAIKSAAPDCRVAGYGHRHETLKRAIEIGAIDVGYDNAAQAVAGSDLVVLCTPVGMFTRMLREVAGALAPGALVTDVGSTKRSVVAEAQRALAGKAFFVGSHPMAGSEKRGVEYARTDLFAGALCILTPTKQTDAGALARAEAFWKGIGMRVTQLGPEEHDQLLADVSHLPHAAACALVAMQADAGMRLAGKGFLDTTRIAGGDGGLWRDILLDNRDNVAKSIQRLKGELEQLSTMLERGDGEAVARWLSAGADRRDRLLKEKLGEVTPD